MGKFTDLLARVTGGEAAAPDDSAAGAAAETEEARPSVRSRSRQSRQNIEREARAADLQRDLDALYTPENWKAIASMYFDARYVSTGDELFQLTKDEQTTLGTSLSATARLMLKIDPGYVAAIIFFGNMGRLIAVKETQYAQKKKRLRGPQTAPPIRAAS